MAVTLKRSGESSLHLVLPSQLEFEEEGNGNVTLLLDNNVRLTSHACFLSFSPVLKSILMNVEVRLDKPCISLPGFSQNSVQHLLQFLHHGSVGKTLILITVYLLQMLILCLAERRMGDFFFVKLVRTLCNDILGHIIFN